jgi:hypothetical protein
VFLLESEFEDEVVKSGELHRLLGRLQPDSVGTSRRSKSQYITNQLLGNTHLAGDPKEKRMRISARVMGI